MNNKVLTNWTQATTNLTKALMGLTACIENGNNAWIEIRKNGDQEFPIKKKNPLLDNPFNWTSYVGVPKNEKELSEKTYFNKTEEDLTYNWTSAFGTKDAIKAYQDSNKLSKDLLLSGGINHPIKICDAQKIRSQTDNYEYGYWVYYWKPKDNIPYLITDDEISEVFTVCYTKEVVDKKEALKKAAEFLLSYSSMI